MFQFIKEWFATRKSVQALQGSWTLEDQERDIARHCQLYNVHDMEIDLDLNHESRDWGYLRTPKVQYYILSKALEHKDISRLLLTEPMLIKYKTYLLAKAPHIYSGIYGSFFQALDAKKSTGMYVSNAVLKAYDIPVSFWTKEYDGVDIEQLNHILKNLDYSALTMNHDALLQKPGVLIGSLMIYGYGLVAMSALLYPQYWKPEHFHAYQTIGQRFSSEDRLSWVNFIVGHIAKQKGVDWHLKSDTFEFSKAFQVGSMFNYVLSNAEDKEHIWPILDEYFEHYLAQIVQVPNSFFDDIDIILFNEPRYLELLLKYQDFFAHKTNYPKYNKVLDLIYRLPESYTWFDSSILAKSKWTLSREELCELCSRPGYIPYFHNEKLQKFLHEDIKKAESMGVSVWDVVQLERSSESNDVFHQEIDVHLG